MSQTFAELDQDVLKAARQQKEETRTRALKTILQSAQNMREILADPRWEEFARGVEQLKAEAEAIQTRSEHDLIEKTLNQEQYTTVKLLHARAKGGADAYKSVLELVHNLIKKGEEAGEQLVSAQHKEN